MSDKVLTKVEVDRHRRYSEDMLLCNSHEALRERAERAEAERDAAKKQEAHQTTAAQTAWTAADQIRMDMGARVRELEAENARLREALERAKDHAAELRSYCDGWEWKYGKDWDAEDKLIVEALAASRDTTPPSGE